MIIQALQLSFSLNTVHATSRLTIFSQQGYVCIDLGKFGAAASFNLFHQGTETGQCREISVVSTPSPVFFTK
jgi:hypothetical protein